MRLPDWLEHPTMHAALTNIGVDQHHIRPSSREVSNTSLDIDPLPGGPGVWDIPMPFDAAAVVFSLQSIRLVELADGRAGVYGIANRSSLETSVVSIGGQGNPVSTSYNAIYSKAAGAIDLSHVVFSSLGSHIALTETYLTLSNPSTRVLRTIWTNYAGVLRTLNCWGEVGILG